MNTKIYIIGGLGSGKSFFAKKLLDKTGIEYFDMDRIVFKEGSFEQRDEKERDNIFENTTNKDHWILEGTFTESWITPGLGEASQIIYLTTHPLIRFYRFIKRILKQGISNQNDLFGRTKLVLGFRYKEWDRTEMNYL
jgi:adenylate kinase family enzyme